MLFTLLHFLPANIPLPQSRNDSVEVANQKRLLRTLEQLTNRLKRTLAKQPLSSFHVSSQMIVADPKSLESKKAFLSCRPGSMLRGRMCGEQRRHLRLLKPLLIPAAVNKVYGWQWFDDGYNSFQMQSSVRWAPISLWSTTSVRAAGWAPTRTRKVS